jgi:hypothetical protein
MCTSLAAVSLAAGASGATYLVAGVSRCVPTEDEPSSGRILLFGLRDRRLILLGEHAVAGAVYSVAALRGHLAAAINSTVLYIRVSSSGDATGTFNFENGSGGFFVFFVCQAAF